MIGYGTTVNGGFAEYCAVTVSYTHLGGTALPFGIYDDDILVGFIMFGYGTVGDEDEPMIAASNYCLWRFMIDKMYQRQGLGLSLIHI